MKKIWILLLFEYYNLTFSQIHWLALQTIRLRILWKVKIFVLIPFRFCLLCRNFVFWFFFTFRRRRNWRGKTSNIIKLYVEWFLLISTAFTLRRSFCNHIISVQSPKYHSNLFLLTSSSRDLFLVARCVCNCHSKLQSTWVTLPHKNRTLGTLSLWCARESVQLRCRRKAKFELGAELHPVR